MLKPPEALRQFTQEIIKGKIYLTPELCAVIAELCAVCAVIINSRNPEPKRTA